MPKSEEEWVSAYLETIKRLEPEIAMIDLGTAYASIAISLKRLADTLEDILLDIRTTRELGK